MEINPNKLLDNFKNMKSYVNLNLLVCTKTLFSKSGISKNIGSYLIIVIILFQIICIFVFYLKQLNSLKDQIKKIIYAINHLKVIKGKKEEETNNKENKEIENEIKIDNNIKTTNDIYEKKNNFSTKKGKIKKMKKKKRNKSFQKGKRKSANNFNYFHNSIINNIDSFNMLNTKNKNQNKEKSTVILPKENSKTEEKKISEQVKRIMDYNDDEINELPYDLALQYDNRTFSQYYILLLRTRHTLIFTFCYNKDYNSKIIKNDLFFIGFSIYYTVNALFFNDNTMHNIYENEGSFDIEYRLTKNVYSSIISMAFNKLLKVLAFSNNSIIEFKQNKNKRNVSERGAVLKFAIKFKSILYFILSIIFLLFLWYYLSMFGGVYSNTQIELLKDTLISFGLSILYPFGLCLLPGLFRIPALSDPKKKKEYLYKFSKLIQMFI